MANLNAIGPAYADMHTLFGVAEEATDLGTFTGATITDNVAIKVALQELETAHEALTHDGFSDFVANEHIDHSLVSITAGAGLTGGGTIAATRTLDVGSGTGISVTADAIALDLAAVIATDGADRVLTSDGDGTLTAESTLTLTATQFTAGNYVFNIDETVGVGQDNYVLTYDNGTGEIGLEAATGSGGLTWNNVTGTSQTMAVNNGYVVDSASEITFTLPSSPSFGDIVAVAGYNTGQFKIAQNAGDEILFGDAQTTTGVTGEISANDNGCSIEIICVDAATNTWTVRSSVGAFTIV